MITDYSHAIKIAIFQSVSERQRAKWATIVKFRPNRNTIFTFYPYLTQKLLDRFHHLAINTRICKAMMHSFLERESKE